MTDVCPTVVDGGDSEGGVTSGGVVVVPSMAHCTAEMTSERPVRERCRSGWPNWPLSKRSR